MTAPVLAVRSSGMNGRGYRHPSSGRVTPSITTVLKAEAKPAISQWVADQTASYAVANVDALLNRTEEQGFGFLRWYHSRNPLPLEEGYDIRNYHEGVLHDAAELGTMMHEWVQADVDPSCTYPDISMQPPQFYEMLPPWEKFLSENFIEPVLTETTVWNETAGYAGTFDCLWIINGELWLIDIKTARSLWPDHSMQMAALKEAETVFTDVEGSWGKGKNATKWQGTFTESEWDISQIKHYGFLHIRPNDIDNKGVPVPGYCELVEAEDLDLHYEAFLGLLQRKAVEIKIKERVKEREASKQSSSE